MRRVRTAEAKIIVLSICISSVFMMIATAKPELESDNGKGWELVSDPYEKYGNWDTYKTEVTGLKPVIVKIKNRTECGFAFAWKTDRLDYREISFYKNGTKQKSVDSLGWSEQNFSSMKSNDDIWFKLWNNNNTNNNKIWVWIAFPSQYYTSQPVEVVEIPSPIAPKGLDSGELGVDYSYSTSIASIKPKGKVKYEFDWGDGSSNNTTCKEVGTDAEANHSWALPNEYKVRVRAWNNENVSGDWSQPLTVVIYQPVIVPDNLQEAIDNSNKYTKLILNKTMYNTSDILIRNKDYLILTSSGGYVNLTGAIVDTRMTIDSSSFIKISQMNLSNAKNGIKMKNAKYCNITNNKIIFGCCGFGILLKSGEYNGIENNSIKNCSSLCRNGYTSLGMIIDYSNNNYIKNNSIEYLDPDERLYHYYVKGITSGNRIIIPDYEENIIIEKDYCVGYWGREAGIIINTHNICDICDKDPRSNVWEPC